MYEDNFTLSTVHTGDEAEFDSVDATLEVMTDDFKQPTTFTALDRHYRRLMLTMIQTQSTMSVIRRVSEAPISVIMKALV